MAETNGFPTPSSESRSGIIGNGVAPSRLVGRLRDLAGDWERAARNALELAEEMERQAAETDDPWLSLPKIKERYDLGRDAIVGAESRLELKVRRRPGRGDIEVQESELERWLNSGPRRTKAAKGDDWVEREVDRLLGGAT